MGVPKTDSEMNSASRELLATREQLDDLLERYLYALDKYDQAQKELSRLSSKAYFALAQANFQSGSGTRYGQDHYDERCKASCRAAIEVSNDGVCTLSVGKSQSTSELDDDQVAPQSQSRSLDKDRSQQSNGEQTTEKADRDEPESKETIPDPKHDNAKSPVDPLRWFGILVPSTLRTCQSTMAQLCDGPVAAAVNASREMRSVETDIRKLRKDVRKLEKSSKGVVP